MGQEKKQLTVFGYGLAVILSLTSVYLWRHHGWHIAHGMLLPCIVAMIVFTAVNYRSLRSLYKRWMSVAHFIGSVITAVILSLLFYLVFGIVGIILRLLRKDLLDRKIDRTVHSYWVNKDQVAFDPNDYTRQF
ncbi:MAG: hypothetical protein KAR32_08195 [Candidatus Omnitrophica bacterium]|nr:hypothetical protein [Candidatus Omnitrophota bacterium]